VKAFLLAAGEGRRLRPMTETLPKCLVPIRGVPLLGIWLRLLEQHGVSDVLVNVHHLHEQVAAFLAAWPGPVAIRAVHERRLLGSAGTVLSNREFVADDPRFLVIYADNLTSVDLSAMLRFHAARPETLALGVTPTDRPREKGTVVLGPGGEVLAFEEKAAEPRSNLANAGIYVTTPRLFEYMPSSLPATEALDFGFHVLPRMVPDLAAYRIEQYLVDIGTPEAYRDAQTQWPGLPGRERQPGAARPELAQCGADAAPACREEGGVVR
jgi:mannose-1-phosphate guanylyltransferase